MMEKLVLNLPLEEIIIRKVVIHLWSINESFDLFLLEKSKVISDQFEDIEMIISGGRFGDMWLTGPQSVVKKSQEWQEAFEKVKVKVTELGLPASLEKKMMLVVKPIGLEMLRGKMSLLGQKLSDSRRDVDLEIFKQLHWTIAGALDYQKTAENVVRLETLDVVKRFRFACLNFLVNHIPNLWKALPKAYQKCFDRKANPLRESVTKDEYYWYYTLKGKRQKRDPSKLFKFSVQRANKAKIKYLFQKLSEVERNFCLIPSVIEVASRRFDYLPGIGFFPREGFSGVLFYLLSEIRHEELEEVLMDVPCQVLGCFLDWPLQDLLPEIVDVVWPFISDDQYSYLCNIMQGHFRSLGYYFPDVFQKFFLRSPAAFRKFFIKHDVTFIPEFVNTKDADTIGLMLRSFDAEERVKLISSSLCSSRSIFNKLVMDDDCDFVKLCLRRLLESAEDRKRVKRTLMARARYRKVGMGEDSRKCEAQKWKKVLESLEDDASAVNKRSSDEKALTGVKRSRPGKKRQRRN